MKIRNGFISNSSSSSFVLLTTKDAMQKVLSELSPNQRKFFKNFLPSAKKGVFLGVNILDYSSSYATETLSSSYEENIQEEPKTERVDGCKHKFDRDICDFCSKCGAASYVQEVEEEVEPEDAALDLFKLIMKKFNQEKDSYADIKDF